MEHNHETHTNDQAMLVDHQTLTEDARTLVFPSSRKFYDQEIDNLEARLKEFCASFALDMGYKLAYGRFVVFFISRETPLSLEDNDALIAFVQKLEKEMDLALLDRMNVCYKQGPYVQRKEVPEFKKMIKSRSVSPKTIVFDNTIGTKGEFDSSWELPAGESWLSHFFK